MHKYAIEIENLGKSYQRRTHKKTGSYQTLRERLVSAFRVGRNRQEEEYFWALRNVNLQIEQGEVVGVIGPNGAGKSTLLKLLSRITEPTEGGFTLRGRVASLLEVGTGFHPELTGRENVFLSGAILGMTRQEIRQYFDEIVAFAGVEDFLDLPVKRYSSGMLVRLGFAVAAHLPAEILLVDEVLAVGDAAFQRKCLGRIGEISTKGRTVLFVSHNLEMVKGICTSCVLISAGVQNRFDNVDAAINKYQSKSGERSSVRKLKRTRTAFTTPRILDVLLIGENRLFYGEVLSLKIKLENKGDARELHFIAGINNPIGGRVFTASTIEDKQAPFIIPCGFSVLTVTFQNIRLKPGVYDVQLSIVKDFNIRYDIVDVDQLINISSIKKTGSNYAGYWGDVMVKSNWQIEYK